MLRFGYSQSILIVPPGDTNAVVSIQSIKCANLKMAERDMLLNEVSVYKAELATDSCIISDQSNIILLQDSSLQKYGRALQLQISVSDGLKDALQQANKQLKKEKRWNWIGNRLREVIIIAGAAYFLLR